MKLEVKPVEHGRARPNGPGANLNLRSRCDGRLAASNRARPGQAPVRSWPLAVTAAWLRPPLGIAVGLTALLLCSCSVPGRLAEVCDQDIIYVTTTEDGDNPDAIALPGRPCTLRAALNTAALCVAQRRAVTIRLGERQTYTLTNAYVPSGVLRNRDRRQADRVGPVKLPRIFGDVTIEGNGSQIRSARHRLELPVGPRYFHILPGASLTLNRLTLMGGRADWAGSGHQPEAFGQGGAIYNEGRLTLNEVKLLESAGGEALCNAGGEVHAWNCDFADNWGAILATGESVTVTRNTRFNSNGVTARDMWGNPLAGWDRFPCLRIKDDGRLRVSEGCVFLGNYSNSGGASAILVDSARVRLEETTFSANGVSPSGAGAAPALTITSGAIVDVYRCTFASNVSRIQSAVFVESGRLRVWQSTFYNNRSDGAHAAIGCADNPEAVVFLQDVTVHQNQARLVDDASTAGGLEAGSRATVGLSNTLFSDNAPRNCRLPGLPTIHSVTLSTDASCPGADFIEAPRFVGDPPLRLNGGATDTLLPATGSSVVDAGSLNLARTDQRGRSRPVGGRTDVGAVERQPDDPER